MTAARILIRDEDPAIRTRFQAILDDAGDTCMVLPIMPEIAIVRDLQPDLTLLDDLRGSTPYGWISLIQGTPYRDIEQIPVLLCTAN